MFFMSTSVVLCRNLILSKKSISFSSGNVLFPSVQFSCVRRKYCGLVTNAKKRHSKKRKWWQRFFFDEEGNWLGLRDEDVLEVLDSEEESSDDELSENEKFEAWKRRAEAIVELREAQEDVKNEENRRWEDWIVGDDVVGDGESWSQNFEKSEDDVGEQISEFFSSRGLVKSVRDLVLGREDDDILYEDRVFRYASFNSVSGFIYVDTLAFF